MANTGLNCLSCLCTCLIVTVSNFIILIGALLFALGVVFTWGLSWIASNEAFKGIMDQLSKLLSADVDALVKSIASVTGSMGIVFLIFGIFVIVLSCVGCIGSCCKVKACLLIYAVVVGLLFIGQLTVVIIWYADSNLLKSSVKGAMEDSVKKYTGFNSGNAESLLQNIVQILVGCCGVNNGSDFQTLNKNWDRRFNISHGGRQYAFNLTYPLTCCKIDLASMQPVSQFCPYNNTASNYRVGCYDKLFTEYIEKYFLNYVFPSLAGMLALLLLLAAGAVLIFFAELSKSKPSKVTPGTLG